MPIPILVVLAWLVDAAVAVCIFWARKIIVAGALALAWEAFRPRLLRIAGDYMPDVMVWSIKLGTGLDITYPLSGESLTRAINQKLGVYIFRDVTNPAKVRQDVAAYACLRANVALPGINLLPMDFLGSHAASERLKKKLTRFVRDDIKLALATGAGFAVSADQYAQITSAIVARYQWVRPPPRLEGLEHQINRDSARWWARHHTLVWV